MPDSLDTLIGLVLIMLVVSLLITIVLQMCAAALNLRGMNLLSGLTSTFAVIAPATGNNKDLADYLLKGGLLSDSFLPNSFLQKWQNWPGLHKFLNWLNHWRHTSAVRSGELFDAIHRIAASKEPAPDTIRDNTRSVLKALGLRVDTSPELQAAARLRTMVRSAPCQAVKITNRTNKTYALTTKQIQNSGNAF